jgi:hypothetical protein
VDVEAVGDEAYLCLAKMWGIESCGVTWGKDGRRGDGVVWLIWLKWQRACGFYFGMVSGLLHWVGEQAHAPRVAQIC